MLFCEFYCELLFFYFVAYTITHVRERPRKLSIEQYIFIGISNVCLVATFELASLANNIDVSAVFICHLATNASPSTFLTFSFNLRFIFKLLPFFLFRERF